VAAQIGSAVPVSGALVVSASRVLAPMIGFLSAWAILLAVGIGISLVAYGMADYVAYFVPGVSRFAVALAAAIGFTLLNLTPVRLALGAQTLMTLGFLAILLMFGVGGAIHVDPGLMRPLMPRGLGAVILAAVPAYFSYSGSFIIVELGGEIRDPTRTIPRALLIGFTIIAACYALVTFAVPAVLPWESLQGLDAPIARAAQAFLPAWAGGIVSIGAILAAATSINGMLLVHSRDVLAMACAEVLPAFAARRNAAGVPIGAVTGIGALGVIGVLVGGSIREYAVLVVISVMLLQIAMAFTLLRLPTALPVAFASAGFRLGRGARWAFGLLTLASSAAFLGLALYDNARNGVVYLGVLGLGMVYYRLRRRLLVGRGVDLDAVLRAGTGAEG
jgi:APA family basic amino acid/polyamine antiporter